MIVFSGDLLWMIELTSLADGVEGLKIYMGWPGLENWPMRSKEISRRLTGKYIDTPG